MRGKTGNRLTCRAHCRHLITLKGKCGCVDIKARREKGAGGQQIQYEMNSKNEAQKQKKNHWLWRSCCVCTQQHWLDRCADVTTKFPPKNLSPCIEALHEKITPQQFPPQNPSLTQRYVLKKNWQVQTGQEMKGNAQTHLKQVLRTCLECSLQQSVAVSFDMMLLRGVFHLQLLT